jgi:hypothetical protein
VVLEDFWMWDLQIVMELLRLQKGCCLLDPFDDFSFATNKVMLTKVRSGSGNAPSTQYEF